jgi:hypothetical protein
MQFIFTTIFVYFSSISLMFLQCFCIDVFSFSSACVQFTSQLLSSTAVDDLIIANTFILRVIMYDILYPCKCIYFAFSTLKYYQIYYYYYYYYFLYLSIM